MGDLDKLLSTGGELDPALKRARLQTIFGPDYTKYITPKGDFEYPVGNAPVGPVAQGPLSPQPAPFKRGALSVGMDIMNAGGMLSQAVGADIWAQAMYEKAADYESRLNAIPQRVARMEDIGSLKDAAVYAYERIAENVPMIATLLLPAGAVGMGARGIGLTARAAKAAGWTASFATDVGLMTGESVDIARKAGQDPDDIRVVGSGIGKAALDFVPFFALARRLGVGPTVEKEFIKQLAEKGFLQRAQGHIGTMIATEVPTEVAQEVINIALDRSLQAKTGDLTDDEISQLKNAAAGAAAVSLGFGGAASVITPRAATDEELNAGKDAAVPKSEIIPPVGRTEPAPIELTTGTISGGEFTSTENYDPYSYRDLFDSRTGEMMLTGREFQKLEQKQRSQIAYDPFANTLSGLDIKPGITPTKTGWFFDPKERAFVYDRGKAKVGFVMDGFEATLDTGENLGMFPTPEAAMQQAEKFAYDNDTVTGVDNEGEYRYEQQDPAKKLASQLARQPQLTPTESAVVQIENAKPSPSPQRIDIGADPVVERAQKDPGLQRLLSVRLEFLADKANYRDTDGQLKNGAKASLEKIDKKIRSYAMKVGLKDPLSHTYETPVVPEKAPQTTKDDRLDLIKTMFETRAKDAAKPKYPNLNETESKLLDTLEEKEKVEGLTQREYESLERLIAKRQLDLGVPESERVKISNKQVEDLIKVAKKTMGKEYVIVTPDIDPTHAASPIQNGPFTGIEVTAGEQATEIRWKDQVVGTVTEGQATPFEAHYQDKTMPFPTRQDAVQWIIDQHIAARTDWKRAPSAVPKQNEGAQLAQSMMTPGRKRLELDMIKAVSKMYNSLVTKPRIVFAHSWNSDLFPKDTKLQELVQRYRAMVTFRDAGTVYMILNNLHSVKEAEEVFAHEMLAHYGLRAFFNPQQLQKIMQLVLKHRGDEVFAHRAEIAEGAGVEPPTGQLTLMQAEEFVATKFEEFQRVGKEPSGFVENFLALVRRVLGRLAFFKASDKDLARIFRDVGRGLRAGVTSNNRAGNFWWQHKRSEDSAASVMGRDVARIAEGDINSLAEVWRAKAALGVLTPLQVTERYNVDGGKEYMETVMQWWARKRTLTNNSVDIAEGWQKLPKKENLRLSAAIFEITEQSDELDRRLTPEEMAKIFEKEGVSKAGTDLYSRIEKEFETILTHLEAGLKRAVLRQHAKSAAEADQLMQLWNKPDKSEFLSASKETLGNLEVGARLSDIENQINHMRTRNYFPLMRFGKYAITVRAKQSLDWKGKTYSGPTEQKRGEVVYFETTESSAAQQERFEQVKKDFPGHLFKLQASVVSDEEFSFLGMPPALFDLIQGTIKLDDKQTESLKELFYLRSPGRAFLRHLVKRRGTAGYSEDALRVFASYMMNAANHIARIEFNPDLTDHLTTMRKFGEENGNVAGMVANYFAKHHQYLMNPKNDLSQLRALGFLWYLGFNVKSALVNLTQVPMVAYPYLASVYGDAKAVGALSNAYKRVVDWRRGKAVLSPDLEAHVARGIAEGFLDESRATELAGLAEGGVLHRILPVDKSARLLNQTAYYGSYLFRHAEKFNREAVFLAAIDLAKSQGIEGEGAFKAARKAVQTTMFEYAKWNRPEFMQGKKSVFFLFWNYMQHLSYLAFGGEGRKAALRVNLMLLMAAGLQGLPFAENILDLIDWTGTEVREALGVKDPRVALREDIRELASQITDRPDLIMHGLGRYYGLGALHVLGALGVPVPQVDVSGSLSAGEPIPGIGELVEPSRDPDKKLGATLVSTLGPVVGVGYTIWKALLSQDPDQWKTWERALPSALRLASQAARRNERGEETFRGGGAVLQFDPLNTEHRTELIANALGFSPTRATQAYEMRSAQEDLRQYWTVRRAFVLENFAWATLQDDAEVRKDAYEAIQRYNRDVPAPQLRLTPEKIQQSLKQRTRLRNLREQGLPNEKAFQSLYRQIAPLYGASE